MRPNPVDLPRFHVLVADDSPGIQLLAKDLLDAYLSKPYYEEIVGTSFIKLHGEAIS